MFPYPPVAFDPMSTGTDGDAMSNMRAGIHMRRRTDPTPSPCAIRAGPCARAKEIPTRCTRRCLRAWVPRATWRVLQGPVGFKLPFLLADLAVATGMLAGGYRSTGGRNYQIAIYAPW